MLKTENRWLVTVLALLTLSMSSALYAQINIPESVRVGVVLSGGGARGLAHVGVIQVLEAQGIKPDIITGTSMGAIIGALYASGRSADEINGIARGMDWSNALSDASPRHHQPYTFRELEAGMTTDLRMSVTREGIAFPRGVIEGQHLEQTLGELFDQNGMAMVFEQLPIHFAALAADLETGEQVILNSGALASAVRASMSIPGALAPVERDGRILVDGGIANNMPIDVARAMGADFIIAVDVTAPLRKREELDSIFSIASQTTSFLVRLNTVQQRTNLRDDEVLILPLLDGFVSTSFEMSDGIIQAGVEAAQKALQVEWSEPLTEEQYPVLDIMKPVAPVVDIVRVMNNSPVSDAVILAQLRQREGEVLNRQQLEQDLSRLYGLDYFSVVRYHIVEIEHKTVLEVRCVARENGNSWLKLGVELADDLKGNSVMGLSASLRSAGLNRYGGTSFARMELGTTPELEFRFLQPLDPALHYFVEPALGYRADKFDVYLDDVQKQPLASYQKQDRWAALSLGRGLWDEAGEIRIGVVRERGNLKFRSGLDLDTFDDVDTSNYDDGFYFLRLGWDSLDDLGFPTQGQRWSITREEHRTGLRAETDFARMLGDFTLSVNSGRNTLLLEGDAQISDSDEASFVDIPFIGGFLELSGLPPRSRFGRHRALLRSVFYRRMNRDGPLAFGLPMFIGASIERGNVWLDHDNISWNNAVGAGSVFLGARTPLGPAYVSFGATDEGDRSFSIFLGQRFR
jgi:NTE family protein